MVFDSGQSSLHKNCDRSKRKLKLYLVEGVQGIGELLGSVAGLAVKVTGLITPKQKTYFTHILL